NGEAPPEPAPAAQPWPFVPGKRLVFLLDASSTIEQGILERWIESHRPEGISPTSCEAIGIPASRRRRARKLDPRLEARLAVGGDRCWAPRRVAWLPPEKHGVREVRFSDLLTLGDPRDPGVLRQAWLLRWDPERHRVVIAEPAPAAALRDRFKQAGGVDSTPGFADFVVRQAQLALERGERRLRG